MVKKIIFFETSEFEVPKQILSIVLDDKIDKIILVAYINDFLDQNYGDLYYIANGKNGRGSKIYEFTISELNRILEYKSYTLSSHDKNYLSFFPISAKVIDDSNDVYLQQIQKEYMTYKDPINYD